MCTLSILILHVYIFPGTQDEMKRLEKEFEDGLWSPPFPTIGSTESSTSPVTTADRPLSVLTDSTNRPKSVGLLPAAGEKTKLAKENMTKQPPKRKRQAVQGTLPTQGIHVHVCMICAHVHVHPV